MMHLKLCMLLKQNKTKCKVCSHAQLQNKLSLTQWATCLFSFMLRFHPFTTSIFFCGTLC
jgi:hypothetical protein